MIVAKIFSESWWMTFAGVVTLAIAILYCIGMNMHINGFGEVDDEDDDEDINFKR